MASASSVLPSMDADLARAVRGSVPVAAFVRRLAERCGITGEPTPLDAFAFHASRLADAGVEPDRTEDLLAALSREGILTPQQSMHLQAEHLRQQAG